jgi:DNA polymerase III sliding clamp (beta) subunit (PCNA family)
MLLHKRNLEIIKIAGMDDARYPMNSLYIDTEAKKAVVTDGHRLVTVSIPEGVRDEDFPKVNGLTASPLAKSCLLPAEAVEKVIKSIPKKPSLHILSYVAIDGVKTDADETLAHLCVTDLEAPQVFTIRKKEGAFPDYAKLLPNDQPSQTICVNARYLMEILQLAQGYDARNCMVEIEVRGPEQPIVIKAKDRDSGQAFEALLMPLRSPKRTSALPQGTKTDATRSVETKPPSDGLPKQHEDDPAKADGGSIHRSENQEEYDVSAGQHEPPE